MKWYSKAESLINSLKNYLAGNFTTQVTPNSDRNKAIGNLSDLIKVLYVNYCLFKIQFLAFTKASNHGETTSFRFDG